MQNDRFLTLEAVLAKTTLSKSALYRTRDFPRAIKLGPKTKAWSENEVNEWMARVREGRPVAAPFLHPRAEVHHD